MGAEPPETPIARADLFLSDAWMDSGVRYFNADVPYFSVDAPVAAAALALAFNVATNPVEIACCNTLPMTVVPMYPDRGPITPARMPPMNKRSNFMYMSAREPIGSPRSRSLSPC